MPVNTTIADFRKAVPWQLIIVFLTFCGGIFLTGISFYNAQKIQLLEEQAQYLHSVCDLKADQIEQWYLERKGDAEVIKSNDPLVKYIYNFLSGTGKNESEQWLRTWMNSMTLNYDYSSVLIIDKDFNVRLTTTPSDTIAGDAITEEVRLAFNEDRIIITDIHRAGCIDYVHMDMIVPLKIPGNPETPPFGAVILRIDPREILFPLVQSWPTPSRSSETLLIRKEGDSIVYLNELRHTSNAPLKFRFPLSLIELLGVQAALGITGVAEGKDYRGIPVIGYLLQIHETGWLMVAKTDKDEINEPLRKTTLITVGIISLLLIINLLIFIFWIWNQRVRLYRRQLINELEKKALERHYTFLVKYANDIITLIDKDFKILEANDKALETYGYSRNELIGIDARKLKSPATLDIVSDRRKQLDETGSAFYETVHKTKDGMEFPIEVSSRVMEIDGQKFYQAIGRNISERKKAEKTAEIRKRIGDIFLTCPDQEIYYEVLKLILDVLKSPFGVFGYIDEDGSLVVPTMTRHIWDKCNVPEKSIIFPKNTWGNSSWPRAIREKKPNYSNSVSNLTPEGHVTLFRHISYPVIFQGDVIGLMQVANKESDYNETDIEILNQISNYLAPILNVRLIRDWTHKTLMSLSTRQDAILSAVPDIIMEVDTNKIYTWANKSGIEFFGEDAIGKEASAYFIGEQNTYQKVSSLFGGNENIIYVENWQKRKDGEKRLLGWWCRVLKDNDGNVTGALSSARDITEQKWAEEEIKRLNEELEERVIQRTSQLEAANRELEAFSYSVSHDLRAPLRSIHSFTKILDDEYKEKLDDEGKRICSVISSSAVQMGGLIDDLLNFSRIGRSALNPVTIDMKKMAVTVFAELTDEKEKARISFRVGRIPPAKGDMNMIRQVWINLLSNSIKYSSGKKIAEITVDSKEDGNMITYYVKDNGVGFEMLYVEKLFGVFQRLHSSSEFEGNGVGLAIVKRIVLRHNGKVWAEGEPGKGATFCFSLPAGSPG